MIDATTQLGRLSIRAQTPDAVFYEFPVCADATVVSPDFLFGIETAAFDGLTDTAPGPAFFYTPPKPLPVNIPVGARKRLGLTYRDEIVKRNVVTNAYTVKLYLTVVEAHPEIEVLPEPQRTQAYDRAIRHHNSQ